VRHVPLPVRPGVPVAEVTDARIGYALPAGRSSTAEVTMRTPGKRSRTAAMPSGTVME
jgi:hypothetical protein